MTPKWPFFRPSRAWISDRKQIWEKVQRQTCSKISNLQPIRVSYTLSLLIFLGIAQKRQKSEKRPKKGRFWPFFGPSGAWISYPRIFLEHRPPPFDSKQSALHAQERNFEKLGPDFCNSKKSEKRPNLTGDFASDPVFTHFPADLGPELKILSPKPYLNYPLPKFQEN